MLASTNIRINYYQLSSHKYISKTNNKGTLKRNSKQLAISNEFSKRLR